MRQGVADLNLTKSRKVGEANKRKTIDGNSKSETVPNKKEKYNKKGEQATITIPTKANQVGDSVDGVDIMVMHG